MWRDNCSPTRRVAVCSRHTRGRVRAALHARIFLNDNRFVCVISSRRIYDFQHRTTRFNDDELTDNFIHVPFSLVGILYGTILAFQKLFSLSRHRVRKYSFSPNVRLYFYNIKYNNTYYVCEFVQTTKNNDRVHVFDFVVWAEVTTENL